MEETKMNGNQGDQEEYTAQLQNNVNLRYDPSNETKCINEYQILDTIGTGSFCKIKRVLRSFIEEDKPEVILQAQYAMKIFHKVICKKQRQIAYFSPGICSEFTFLDAVQEEIKIWQHLNNPHILKLYEILDDDEHEKLMLVMQLADLGQIMDWIPQDRIYRPSQKVLAFLKTKYFASNLAEFNFDKAGQIIFKQVIMGLSYLHSKNIIHRDIKPDNILVMSNDQINPDSPIKLADFTTARKMGNNNVLYDCSGTIGFRAPEIAFSLNEGYAPLPVDTWSLGICIYTFFNNKVPFYNPESELQSDISAKNDELTFDGHKFKNQDLIDLLKQMLQKTPKDRISLDEILKHKWFTI